MKWRPPTIGSKRQVKRFAFLPVEVEGGYKVWLEWYLAEEEYVWCFYENAPIGIRWRGVKAWEIAK